MQSKYSMNLCCFFLKNTYKFIEMLQSFFWIFNILILYYYKKPSNKMRTMKICQLNCSYMVSYCYALACSHFLHLSLTAVYLKIIDNKKMWFGNNFLDY